MSEGRTRHSLRSISHLRYAVDALSFRGVFDPGGMRHPRIWSSTRSPGGNNARGRRGGPQEQVVLWLIRLRRSSRSTEGGIGSPDSILVRLPIARVFCSPLQRAVETCELAGVCDRIEIVRDLGRTVRVRPFLQSVRGPLDRLSAGGRLPLPARYGDDQRDELLPGHPCVQTLQPLRPGLRLCCPT